MKKHLKIFFFFFTITDIKTNKLYVWSKPLHLVLTPAAEIGQVSQRLAARWERSVYKQAPCVEAGVSQLSVALAVEPDRVGGAPLVAVLVSQVDDGEGVSGLTHDEVGAPRRTGEGRCSQVVEE